MVFKGRFFSSKKSDPSSPDGSSDSPRSLGSNSPIRSDKKKAKSGSTSKDNSPITPSSVSTFKDKKKDDKGKESPSPNSAKNPVRTLEPELRPTSVSVSPIVASSLGLNKIKTRSGPLPQESFYGYASRDKGNLLGASNLSKNVAGGRGCGDGPSSSVLSKKDEKRSLMGSAENVDNRSNLDSMSSESGRSRDQSPNVPDPSRLQNGESSSDAGSTKNLFGSQGPVLFRLAAY